MYPKGCPKLPVNVPARGANPAPIRQQQSSELGGGGRPVVAKHDQSSQEQPGVVRDGQRAATIDQRRPEMARERPRATRHGQSTAKETPKLTRNSHKTIPRLTKDVQLIPDIIKS